MLINPTFAKQNSISRGNERTSRNNRLVNAANDHIAVWEKGQLVFGFEQIVAGNSQLKEE